MEPACRTRVGVKTWGVMVRPTEILLNVLIAKVVAEVGVVGVQAPAGPHAGVQVAGEVEVVRVQAPAGPHAGIRLAEEVEVVMVQVVQVLFVVAKSTWHHQATITVEWWLFLMI